MFEYADPTILCAKGSFSDVDLLETITNKMLPLVQILPFLSPQMSFLYFDLMTILNDDGSERERQLAIKHIPDAITPMMTNTCCGFTWYEQKVGIDRGLIDVTSASGTNTIIVDKASNFEGMKTPTQISITIKATKLIFVAMVTAIAFGSNDKVTFTLDRPTPAALAKGDVVMRGAKDKKQCEDVNNTYGTDKMYQQTGQFQTFAGNVDFEICELNQELRIANQKNIESGIYLMNYRIAKLFKGLVLELSWALLLGTNTVKGTYGSKMQGLITKIQSAQTKCGLSLIQKIDCCGKNPSDPFKDQKDTVANIVAFLQERIKSGLYKEEVTLLLNQAGYDAIEALRPAIENYLNAPNSFITHSSDTYEGMRDYKVIKAMSFRFSSGHYVDFVQFPVFDAITEGIPMAIALPKEMISFVQKHVVGIDADAKKLLYSNGQFPSIKMRKHENFQAGNYTEECRRFMAGMDLGQMIVGAEHGAYGLLLGFSACQNLACAKSSADIVNFVDTPECVLPTV